MDVRKVEEGAEMKSFVAEILTSASQQEKEEILTKLSRLYSRANRTKIQIYELMTGKYHDFLPTLSMAENLTVDVTNLSVEVKDISDNIDNELKCQLNMSTGEFQSLSSQLQETEAIVVVLEKLIQIDDEIIAVESSLKNKEFSKAADSLLKIGDLLDEKVIDTESEIKVLISMEQEQKVQKANFLFVLHEFWRETFIWKLTDKKNVGDKKSHKLTIVYGAHGFNVIVDAANAYHKMNLLDKMLEKLSEQVIEYFIKPIVTNANAKLQQDSSGDKKCLTIVVPEEGDGKIPSPLSAFKKIGDLLKFLETHFLSIQVNAEPIDAGANDDTICMVEKISLMEMFGHHCAGMVIELLVNECLSHAIPTGSKELEKFSEVVNWTSTFQKHLLDMKFILTVDTKLMDYVENSNILFANKKCRHLFEHARDLMTAEIHNTVVISPEKPIGELPPLDPELAISKKGKQAEKLASEVQLSENTFRLPVCHVSISVQDLMVLAYGTLHEATESSPQCAIQLFYAVRDIFELFCCVFPTYHKQSLATLPQLSAIHHNNCMFISHHLLTLGHQFSSQLPAPLNEGAGTFVDLIPKIRKLGVSCFVAQIENQKKELAECLQGANGFGRVSEVNYDAADKAIKRCLHQLRHLQKIWQCVLPTNIYAKAICTLLNAIITEIISCIVVLEDISTDDASQLYSLLSGVALAAGPLLDPKLATANVEIELQKNVPKWRRFSELIMVLNASLQDIGDRWAEGKGPLAVEFSSNEMKQLVRALFKNSDRRAAVLAKI